MRLVSQVSGAGSSALSLYLVQDPSLWHGVTYVTGRRIFLWNASQTHPEVCILDDLMVF